MTEYPQGFEEWLSEEIHYMLLNQLELDPHEYQFDSSCISDEEIELEFDDEIINFFIKKYLRKLDEQPAEERIKQIKEIFGIDDDDEKEI